MNTPKDQQPGYMALKKSPALLAAAKRIFGETLVVDAWVAGSGWSLTDAIEEAEQGFDKIKDNGSTSREFSMSTIVIEFNNSRRIAFSSSEWSHFWLIDSICVETP